MIKVTDESHVDHGLTPEQLAHALDAAAQAHEGGLLIRTVDLPPDLGTVPCGLFGPIMGDEPVSDDLVIYASRGNRTTTSRMVHRKPRQVSTVTVIAGPHNGDPLVLYTAFGGPLAPREPDELEVGTPEHAESRAFWDQHALSAVA